ncbi:hypothetical protein [Phyllobacterium sp. YR531]|uniref:hypothetical protein n=1 Tax=Phyllobacterium sp. YR531 TaxID=1144343 RepID=UPI0002E3E185|nr:hypothetical protein [Phyllobacterium sp. YR531]
MQITAAYVVGATFQKGFLLESLVILIASIISVFAIHTNSSVGTMVVAGYELIKNGKPTLFMYIYKFAFVYIAYIAWRVFTAPKPLSF